MRFSDGSVFGAEGTPSAAQDSAARVAANKPTLAFVQVGKGEPSWFSELAACQNADTIAAWLSLKAIPPGTDPSSITSSSAVANHQVISL